MKIWYEIKAYKNGSNGNNPDEWQFGTGKRAKAQAIKKGQELKATGEYEAIFVDALNECEIIDDECTTI
jgi:hypothetical protein